MQMSNIQLPISNDEVKPGCCLPAGQAGKLDIHYWIF